MATISEEEQVVLDREKLRQEVDILAQQASSYKSQKLTYEKEVGDLIVALAEKEAILKSIEESIKAASNTEEEYKVSINNKMIQLDEARKESTDLANSIQTLKTENEVLVKENEALVKKHEDLDSGKDKKSKELATKLASVDVRLEAIQDKEEDLIKREMMIQKKEADLLFEKKMGK